MFTKILPVVLFCAAAVFSQENYDNVVDLTYSFEENTIFWPTEEGFRLEVQFNGTTEKGFHYSSNKFQTPEHGGTHMDAPVHFFADGNTADKVELNSLIGAAIVIDISGQTEKNIDYQLMPEDLTEWEKSNGRIPDNSIVIIKTGLGKYWPDRKKYMGTDERGAQAVAKLHFPGLHHSAAAWLIEERKLKAVGIESPSIDYGQSTLFETHVLLGGNNIPIFENVANVDKLPLKGFTVIALPMKIKGGSGGPLRIIALL